MTDDKTKRYADGKRISLCEEYEVRYWTDKFGCSEDALKSAVEHVGDMADDVGRFLTDREDEGEGA